jgi:antirestriction protein ArdC
MDVYEIVTKRIVESLEQGTVPWQCPWQGGEMGLPRNFVSTKPYRGINVFLLAATRIAKGYNSPFWVSYKQARDLGGNVKQGEKSPSFVVFYKMLESKEVNEDGELDHFPMLRYTPMFNTDQCEGLNVPDISKPLFETQIIEDCEKLVSNMPSRPEIRSINSGRAFYSINNDAVTVPLISQFPKAEGYYSTLFHELGHSTGAKHRLNREFGTSFGDHLYSREELVAEFTASFLCGVVGIEQRTVDNSAAYIASWLTVLKDKHAKKWIPWAASHAQKAADFIRGLNNSAASEVKEAA